MISVIMPVYNTGQFLEEAISSVVSQSYKDWELLLVDDGSTDNSPEICDRFASSDSRIKVIHQANKGLSGARNVALNFCKGDFITFLDSDDLIPSDALQVYMDIYAESKADIISGYYLKFYEKASDIKINKKKNIEIERFSVREAIETTLYQKKIDNSVWGKLYVARIWENIRFLEGSYYEDLDIFYKLFLKANEIILIPDITYYYRQHSSSYIHTFNLRRKDMLSVTGNIVKFMQQNCQELLPAARSRQLSANFNMFMLLAAHFNEIDGDSREEAERIEHSCWNKIKELRKESLFNPRVRLKNKIGILLSYAGGKHILKIISRFTY